MRRTLNNLGTQAPNGAIFLAQQQNSAEETALNTDITNENALLATQKTQLTDELNTANEILQSIPSQLNEVNEMYSAITGYNQSPMDKAWNETSYQQQTLAGATGVELIVALYDGRFAFSIGRCSAWKRSDVAGRRVAVKKALDILMYLQARLRPDVGGTVAASLWPIFMRRCLR